MPTDTSSFARPPTVLLFTVFEYFVLDFGTNKSFTSACFLWTGLADFGMRDRNAKKAIKDKNDAVENVCACCVFVTV